MLLNHKVNFPTLVAHSQQIAVIAPVEEFFTLIRAFAPEVVELVVAIQVHLVGNGRRFVAFNSSF